MSIKPRLYIKIFIIAIATIGILGYAFFRTENLLVGPQINIETPRNGQAVHESLVRIDGNAQNIRAITLNDRKIFINENGDFNENLLLSYGYSIFELSAEDRFGRTVTKTLEVVYK